MNRSAVSLLTDRATVAIPITAARPGAAGDGVDIKTWRSGSFTSPFAVVLIDGDQAITLSSPTGGAGGPELWGLINGLWKPLTFLNKGASIAIADATHGYAEEVEHVGICTRLHVAATPDVGAPTVIFIPLESWGGA